MSSNRYKWESPSLTEGSYPKRFGDHLPLPKDHLDRSPSLTEGSYRYLVFGGHLPLPKDHSLSSIYNQGYLDIHKKRVISTKISYYIKLMGVPFPYRRFPKVCRSPSLTEGSSRFDHLPLPKDYLDYLVFGGHLPLPKGHSLSSIYI